jgi:hypothetical protein
MSLVGPGEGVSKFDPSVTAQENFYTGAFNSDVMYRDPLIVGFAFIVWTKLPSWVEKEYPNFKQLTQKNFQGFDGLTDIELATAASTEGFSANEYHSAQGIAAKPSGFNLKHEEFSGSPIRHAYSHWVSGIRDPRTGIATYPKNYDLDYAAKNHTGELMYFLTRPDANNTGKNIIEFAAYWTAIMPKKIALGHLNYAKGTQNVPNEIDMPFSGIMHIGPKVDAAAVSLLDQVGFEFVTEGEHTPETVK